MDHQESQSSHPDLLRLRQLRQAGRQKRILTGLSLPLRAIRLIMSTPALWGWAILPALINIVLFVITFGALIFNAGRLLNRLWGRPEVAVWYEWLFLGLWHLSYAAMIVLSAVLAYFVVLLLAGVVGSPAQEKLSQETERALTGAVADARGPEPVWLGVVRAIATSLLTLIIYLLTMACLLTLHLIPLVGNLAYAVLGTLVSFFFLAIEYSEGTLDRRGHLYRERLRTLRQNPDLSGSFGAGLTVLLFIPVLNLVVMPIAVVAGTMLALSLSNRTGIDDGGE